MCTKDDDASEKGVVRRRTAVSPAVNDFVDDVVGRGGESVDVDSSRSTLWVSKQERDSWRSDVSNAATLSCLAYDLSALNFTLQPLLKKGAVKKGSSKK